VLDPAQQVAITDGVQQIAVQVNDLVVTTYRDFYPSEQLSAKVEVLESVLGTVNAGTSILVGAVLSITVDDLDANIDSTDRDRVVVEVRVHRTNSFQFISLIETHDNSGVFVGSILTRPTSVASTASILEGSASGALTEAAILAGMPLSEVQVESDGDDLTIFFNDTAPKQIVKAQVLVLKSILGEISLSKERVASGSYLTVTVVDPDAAGSAVQLRLMAKSLSTPVLLNANVVPGAKKTFKAIFGIRSEADQLESHSYKVEPFRLAGKPLQLPLLNDGEVVEIAYMDHGPEASVSVFIPVCSAATVEIHPLLLGLGTHVLVRLRDLDLANRVGLPLQVIASNLNSMHTTVIILHEEVPPGTFTGRLLVSHYLQDSSVPAAPEELFANKGDTIGVSFQDSCPTFTASVQALAKNIGTITLSATSNGQLGTDIRSGGVLSIAIVDEDLDDLPDETEQIECRCWSGGSVFEHVRLIEDGLHSSRFTGRLLTADVFNIMSASEPSADSVTSYTGRGEEAERRPQDYFYPREVSRLLNPYTPAMIKDAYTASTAIQAQNDFEAIGADILCEYLDIAPRARQIAKAHIVQSDRGVLIINPKMMLGAGGAIHVTVNDNDLTNGSPAAIVAVHSQSDILHIVLTESGPGTGVFTGKGLTSESASADENALLLRVHKDDMGVYETIKVMYQEEAPYLLHSFDLKVQRSHKGRLVVYPSVFGIGSTVQIAVVDADLMMGEFSEAGAIKTENVNECASTGKDYCAFPFYYMGDAYSACTSRDEFSGRLWCAITTQYTPSKWEYCECTCKGCETPAATVHLEISGGQTLDVNLTQAPGRAITAAQAAQSLDPKPFPPLPGGRVGGPLDVYTGTDALALALSHTHSTCTCT